MVSLTYTEGQGYAVEERPVPGILKDEILVRVESASVCGTDVRIIRNGQRKLRQGEAVVLGHEFAGTIVDCGADVTGYSPGMRIGVAPNLGCGTCAVCKAGLPNMCTNFSAYGINIDGAFTEHIRIRGASIQQKSVFTLPDDLSFEQAALLEPLSCVINGANQYRVAPGESVIIHGAGPIGLFHLMLAKAEGAAKIIVADWNEKRLAHALALGATETIVTGKESVSERVKAATDGLGVDVAVTACSVKAVQEMALTHLAPYGRLCLFGGLPKNDSVISVDSNLIHYKNITVFGCTGGAPAHYAKALDLVHSGKIDCTALITHRFGFDALDEGIRTALSDEPLKVVFSRE